MRPRAVCLAFALTAACLAPGAAFAHAGPTPPVATSFLARIASTPPGIQVRIVDADQQLWLHVPPSTTVVVLGLAGEPYLLFSALGVEINEHSPTTYLNRAQPAAVPAAADPRRPPLWQRLQTGRSYRWHEDRLHALAFTAQRPKSRYLGRWVIQLRVNGRPARIVGGLWYTPPPTRLWFWPIPVVLVCLAALLRLRRPRLDAIIISILTLTELAAIVATHALRDLYGRPTVPASQLAWLASSSALALLLALLILRPRWRAVAILATASYALTEGLTLLPTLYKGHTIGAFPPPFERLTALTALTASGGALLVLFAGTTPSTRRDDPYATFRRRRA
jgi:hypothetical protein